jgi:hypothetical protein
MDILWVMDLFEEATQDLEEIYRPTSKAGSYGGMVKAWDLTGGWSNSGYRQERKKAEFEQRALKYATIKSTVGGTWWME